MATAEVAETSEAARTAEGAQTAEAANAAEASKAAARTAEATEANTMPDAVMDMQLPGRRLSVRTGSGERSRWRGHGDQTKQKKHSSDLHFDLRRRKAALMSTRVVVVVGGGDRGGRGGSV